MLALSGGAAVLAVGASTWPFTVDDAYILARYAERTATGLGHTMNAGPSTDGVTGPLGLLPGIVAAALGFDAVLAAKVAGLGASAGAVIAALLAVGRRAGGCVMLPMALAVLSAQVTIGAWGGAGLETGLATLVFTFGALAAVRRPAPQGHLLAICAGLMAWLRPEALPAMLVLLAFGTLRRGRGRRLAVLIAGAGVLGVLVYRFVSFGSLLPLSVMAKPVGLVEGVPYVFKASMAITGATGLALVAWAARWGTAGDRALASALAVHLGAVALAGGDWMPGFRLLAPILPIYGYLVGVGALRARLALRGGLGRGALALALALAVAVPALDVVVQVPRARAAGAARETSGRELASWLGSRATRVAMVDVGFIPREAGLEVVDLGGVTDPLVARLPGRHLEKLVEEAYLAQREPDALVLHSVEAPPLRGDGLPERLLGYPVEQRVARMSWVQANFRVARVVRYAPSYFYVVYLPREGQGAE